MCNYWFILVEVVVEVCFDGVVVGGEVVGVDEWIVGEVCVVEIVILVFGFGWLVWGEYVFEVGIDGVVVVMIVGDDEGGWYVVYGYFFVVVWIGVVVFYVE